MLKCFFPAWIAAWFVAIFLPSAIIAYLGLSPSAAEIGVGFDSIFATTWKVGDDVGPFAKLSFGALLLAQFFAVQRMRLDRVALYVVAIAAGAFTMVFALAFLPAEHSRGFGIGLTGERFAPTLTAIYVLGGAVAGGVFAFASKRCAKRG